MRNIRVIGLESNEFMEPCVGVLRKVRRTHRENPITEINKWIYSSRLKKGI